MLCTSTQPNARTSTTHAYEYSYGHEYSIASFQRAVQGRCNEPRTVVLGVWRGRAASPFICQCASVCVCLLSLRACARDIGLRGQAGALRQST